MSDDPNIVDSVNVTGNRSVQCLNTGSDVQVTFLLKDGKDCVSLLFDKKIATKLVNQMTLQLTVNSQT